MEQSISFQITPLDERLRPQVSRALEKRTELISRQVCPKLWELTDRLNSVEKRPWAVRENRRRRRSFLGIWNWLLGEFLLLPGLMEPRELLIPLAAGAVCFAAGVVTLWRNRRRMLGVLSLITAGVLCLGALGNPEELGRLLPLGIVDGVVGAAALVMGKRAKDPFAREAERLMSARVGVSEGTGTQVIFSPEGMTVRGGDGAEYCTVPYSSFAFILETEELVLPIWQDSVILLQKKDLLEGDLTQLRELLEGQTRWAAADVPEQPARS